MPCNRNKSYTRGETRWFIGHQKLKRKKKGTPNTVELIGSKSNEKTWIFCCYAPRQRSTYSPAKCSVCCQSLLRSRWTTNFVAIAWVWIAIALPNERPPLYKFRNTLTAISIAVIQSYTFKLIEILKKLINNSEKIYISCKKGYVNVWIFGTSSAEIFTFSVFSR